MFTMDTMEAPQSGSSGTDGEGDEASHNKLEDMIKELGTALTGNKLSMRSIHEASSPTLYCVCLQKLLIALTYPKSN